MQKKTYTYDEDTTSWSLSADTRFVYDGWNLIQELDATQAVQKEYVWGLDLSQSLQGAGGVGGLLAMAEGGNTYLYCHDANGNVVRLMDDDGGTVPAAAYEYADFGGIVHQSGGTVADENPFRFSTKYFDKEVGLYYYGFRYYEPGMGRWLNRDPLGEMGGLNLYGFVGNDPVDEYDMLGLVFGITYVQYSSLLGHGWIRTGDYQMNVDVTKLVQRILKPIVTLGTGKYKVESATGNLPVGFGFYPKHPPSMTQALMGVEGKWDPNEIGKEASATFSKEQLKEWDTNLKERVFLGDVVTFEYGTKKGICCANADRASVLDCLSEFAKQHHSVTYRLPFLSCRARAKQALEACCLEKGSRLPTSVGRVDVKFIPIGVGP